MKIKTQIISILGLGFVLIHLGLLGEMKAMSKNENQLQSGKLRYLSFVLADEFRQTSMGLTRLARTYVVTGEQKYWDQYFDIVNWRNGKIPRRDYVNGELNRNRKKCKFIL